LFTSSEEGQHNDGVIQQVNNYCKNNASNENCHFMPTRYVQGAAEKSSPHPVHTE